MLKTFDTMKEYSLIRQGAHSAYSFGSDSVNNSESYLMTIARDFTADEVSTLAEDIKANTGVLSDEFGMHPDRYKAAAFELLKWNRIIRK